jgi:hypothetical protein
VDDDGRLSSSWSNNDKPPLKTATGPVLLHKKKYER